MTIITWIFLLNVRNQLLIKICKSQCCYQTVKFGLIEKSKRKCLHVIITHKKPSCLVNSTQTCGLFFKLLSFVLLHLILHFHDPYAHTALNPLQVSFLPNNRSPRAVKEEDKEEIIDRGGLHKSLSNREYLSEYCKTTFFLFFTSRMLYCL